MGLIFDHPRLAALTLTRVAAEEAQGPGELTSRMHAIIEDLMRRHGGNLSAAAREAQIDRKHLRELIRKYGLDPRHKLDGEAGEEDAD